MVTNIFFSQKCSKYCTCPCFTKVKFGYLSRVSYSPFNESILPYLSQYEGQQHCFLGPLTKRATNSSILLVLLQIFLCRSEFYRATENYENCKIFCKFICLKNVQKSQLMHFWAKIGHKSGIFSKKAREYFFLSMKFLIYMKKPFQWCMACVWSNY